MPITPKRATENAVVFLDIAISDRPIGRLKLELFLPLAESFRRLFTGEATLNGRPIGLKRTAFGRIVHNTAVHDGVEGVSTAVIAPNSAEITTVGVVCAGESEKGDFFVSLAPMNSGNFRVIGELFDEESLFVVRIISNTPVDKDGRFTLPVKIVECGQY